MLSAIVWTQKGHFLTSQRVFWTIVREIPCTDYFSRRVREKINQNKKKIRSYISRICSDAPLRSIGTNFGLHVRFVDVINCAKFYRNRLRGLDSVRGREGSKFDHSHWIATSPLTLCELLFTLWLCCPARLVLRLVTTFGASIPFRYIPSHSAWPSLCGSVQWVLVMISTIAGEETASFAQQSSLLPGLLAYWLTLF